MWNKIKEWFLSARRWIALVVIGLVAWVALWWQISKEQNTPDDVRLKKQKEQEALLEQSRKVEEERLLAAKKEEEARIHADALKEKIRLLKLSKENDEAFKKELETKLGVKEKKKKGRPKKS